MTASLSDILTTSKNLVVAVNNLSQNILSVSGSKSRADVSSTMLVQAGQGRLVRVIVTTAGTTAGSVYDASSASVTTSKIATIPNTVGVIELSAPINNGIVVAPGTGQVISVTYS